MNLRVWSTISGFTLAVLVVGAISYWGKESGGSKESTSK